MEWIMIGIWASVFIATLIIELNTADLTTIWFCVSSLITLVVSVFMVEYYIQIVVFIVSTLVLLIATRPLTKRMMNQEIIHTNADKVVNMIGVVTTLIPVNGIGEILVNNTSWRAVTLDSVDIQEGEQVTVNSISGNKVVVSKVNQPKNIEIL